MKIPLAYLFGAILDILGNAVIYYIVVRFLVFITGLILKPIYKKRLFPNSKVEETKRKVFKNVCLLLMTLSVLCIAYNTLFKVLSIRRTI